MAKWIRWWGIGVFVAIALFWWLCIDFIVKAVIETVGTQALGAKVELNSAKLQLVPAGLTLTDLQVTDPDAPMSNLLIASKIEASLDSFELFARRLIADEMTVSGLQFNTPRQTSGAIKGRLLSDDGGFDSDSLNIGSSIPGLSLPNVDELVDKEKVKIKNEYAKINKNIKDIEADWEKRLDELPDKEKIEEYKKRIKEIKKGKFLEQLAGLKSIKKDIDKDRENIKNLNDQFKKDLETVKNEINRAKQLPKDHINNLLAELGLGENALDGIAAGIMSGQIKQWLQQGLSFIKPGEDNEQGTEQAESAPTRGEGIWVHFTEKQAVPEALVRQAKLDGIFVASGQTINFQGEARDLTHQPDQWHKPATFNIDGSSDQNSRLKVNGVFDHRTAEAKDSVDFQIVDLPLENYDLSDKPEMKVLAKTALANVTGNLAVNGDNIDLDVKSKFSGVDLQVTSTKDSTLTSVLVDTLQGVKNFNLALQLNGSLQKPAVTVKSDLDNLLGSAVGKGIKKETDALKSQLTNQLQAQIGPDLQAINQQGGALSSIEEQLAAKQSELKGLTKGF